MTANAEVKVPKKQDASKRHGFWYDLFRRMLKEKPLGTFGLIVVIILLITGIFANFIAPYNLIYFDITNKLQGPSIAHWLGTDQLGRDVLSRIIYGARVSMYIGIAGTIMTSLISILIGVISGFAGGKIDLFIQRFVDVWMSMPGFLLLLTIMSIIGNGMLQIIIVIGITLGIGFSRVIRSAVIGIKSNVYVSAAESVGSSSTRTMLRHILPNIMAPIIINFTIGIGTVIMMEASLSFLGFGVPPGHPSWGSMLSAEGRQYMQQDPGLALWPGLALTLAVYGTNMFGDALRDLLDPRLRGGVGRYSLTEDEKKKKAKILTGS